MREEVEKIVEVYITREILVPVPQIVEKIVAVEKIVELPPKIIEIEKQIIVEKPTIQIVDRPVTNNVYMQK